MHEEVDELLYPKGKGRPRQLATDVFLAAVIQTALQGWKLTLVNVHGTLTNAIPASMARALGTLYKPSPGEPERWISVRMVRYLLSRIELVLAFTEGRAPGLGDEERDEREASFKGLLNRVLAVSLPTGLPRPSAFALDATAVDAWGKGKKRRKEPGSESSPSRRNPRRLKKLKKKDRPTGTEEGEPVDEDDIIKDSHLEGALEEGHVFDPDAEWGYRTKTYDNRTNACFGYNMFAMVNVPPLGTEKGSVPKVAWRIALRPANVDEVEPGLSLLDELREEAPVEELLADRAWSYAVPERWANELRARDVEPVFDLHPADRGVRDYKQMQYVDGWGHCPCMSRINPETGRDRIDIRPPEKWSVGELKKKATPVDIRRHKEREEALAQFRADVDERWRWAFELVANAPNGAKDPNKQRWTCPAQVGKVRCPLVKASMRLSETLPLVENPPGPETAPPSCKGRTFTVPGEVTAKLRQRHYWGSEKWIESYTRRTNVEGYFGNWKNSSTENVNRGWCKVVGIVKTALLAVCAAAATNIRLLRTWSTKEPVPPGFSDPLCEPDPPDYGYEELAEDGSIALYEHPPDEGG